MAIVKRNKYTQEDDRLMWKYYIRRLKAKDPLCKTPSLQFWGKFKEKYGWDRAVSGIESHFRKQLKETVHLSGMRDKYLFPVMKQLNTQLNLSDYTELERKYRCEITIGSNMVFIKAMRGNTDLSVFESGAIGSSEDSIFESEKVGDTNPEPILPASTTNDEVQLLRPSTSSRLTPNQEILSKKSPDQLDNTPIASRTRSTSTVKRKATLFFNNIFDRNESIRSHALDVASVPNSPKTTFVNVKPSLIQIKEVLSERIKAVLNREIPANELDNHSYLKGENVKGFETMLNQQKLMLSVLMADDNELRFFDQDFGEAKFKKHKSIPRPKMIKVEPAQIEVVSNASTESDDQYAFIPWAIPDSNELTHQRKKR